MTDLLNIAKECGARVNWRHLHKDGWRLDCAEVNSVNLTPAQLQATVDQVCKPLIDALEESQMTIKGIIDMYIRNRDALNADYWHQVWNINANLIDAYRKLIGQE